jgi:hypothetical protein
MTMDGVIIVVIQPGIEGYLMTGEITIETICGEDDLGIIIPFITATLIDIGGAVIGEMIMWGDILVDTVVVLVDMVIVVVVEDMMVTVEDMVVIVVGMAVGTVAETKDN